MEENEEEYNPKSWSEMVAPLVAMCKLAVTFGQEVSWDHIGAHALGKILKKMAEILDRDGIELTEGTNNMDNNGWLNVEQYPAPTSGIKFDAWVVHPESETYGVRMTDIQMRGDNTGFGIILHYPDKNGKITANWEYLEQEGPIYPKWILRYWRPISGSPYFLKAAE